MNFADQSIKQFTADLSSDLPAPGGGAAAGLVSSLAGSLNSMVYSLTVGKKSYKELDSKTQDMIKRFQEASKKFTDRSLELMDEDRDNFLELMKSYKLPKETEEDKVKRAQAIKENTIKAMKAPLSLGRECLKFYDNLKVMAQYGNKMVMSDLQMSCILLHCAIESSIINIKVNLKGLKNEEFFEEINHEVRDMFEKSKEEKEKLCEYIEKIYS